MPIYSYICPVCEERHYEWNAKYVGTQILRCPNNCKIGGVNKPAILQRDYQDEKATVMPDWEPGYNPGIGYHYKNKADLMGEIKRRGLYPSVHGGGIHSSNAKPGLYGDEEFREMYSPSKPEQEDEEIRS